MDASEIGCSINLITGEHYGPCKGSCGPSESAAELTPQHLQAIGTTAIDALTAESLRLRAVNAKLLKALEPFAALAEDSPADAPDSHCLYDGAFVGISLGDARLARAAIKAAKS